MNYLAEHPEASDRGSGDGNNYNADIDSINEARSAASDVSAYEVDSESPINLRAIT